MLVLFSLVLTTEAATATGAALPARDPAQQGGTARGFTPAVSDLQATTKADAEADGSATLRVRPSTVDTPAPAIAVSGSTYAQNTRPGDHSARDRVKVGSYDSGTNKANAFLRFGALGATLKDRRVSAATLTVWALWSSSCVPSPFSVHPVTTDWTPAGVTGYPGPAFDPTPLGTVTPEPGASCANTTGASSVGVRMHVPLDASWFTRIATEGGADHGLALTAPTGDAAHWKKFHSSASATAAWRPSLDLTYEAVTPAAAPGPDTSNAADTLPVPDPLCVPRRGHGSLPPGPDDLSGALDNALRPTPISAGLPGRRSPRSPNRARRRRRRPRAARAGGASARRTRYRGRRRTVRR
ncbi:DNRLRE domain-containing protein [Streptomyces sp. NPDC088554]|uniref:DNRLRE domain-containing protein n=1 Tax=Streptomyces sp. NPDC088554 TaxID=3365865 RepID=UPI0037FE49FE